MQPFTNFTAFTNFQKCPHGDKYCMFKYKYEYLTPQVQIRIQVLQNCTRLQLEYKYKYQVLSGKKNANFVVIRCIHYRNDSEFLCTSDLMSYGTLKF